MSHALLNDLATFLDDLEETQTRLGVLYDRKRDAFREVDAHRLRELSGAEAQLGGRMRQLVQARQDLLRRAALEGRRADSLAELVADAPMEWQPLAGRVQRARERSTELRREGWVHWVVAQRAHGHVQELMELVANHGQRQPVYEERASQQSSGGAILDASA